MAAIDSGMTSITLSRAKTHVFNVCSTGGSIYLIKPGMKDEMGTIIGSEVSQEFKASPIRFAPYTREIVEKISWAETTDILCFISKLAVDNETIPIEKLRRYVSLRHDNKIYDLRYVELYSSFADDFLYVVLGGKK